MVERDEDGLLSEFVKATVSRTNVADQRATRFRYFADALAKNGGALTDP